MKYLKESLILRPSEEELRLLDTAAPLSKARRDWLSTLLGAAAVYVLLRRFHLGEISSLMIAIILLAALATCLAPRLVQAFCAHAVRRMRMHYLAETTAAVTRLRQVRQAYGAVLASLAAILLGYNVLALSAMLAFAGTPLELTISFWPALVWWSIPSGWIGLLLGERWLLRSLES